MITPLAKMEDKLFKVNARTFYSPGRSSILPCSRHCETRLVHYFFIYVLYTSKNCNTCNDVLTYDPMSTLRVLQHNLTIFGISIRIIRDDSTGLVVNIWGRSAVCWQRWMYAWTRRVFVRHQVLWNKNKMIYLDFTKFNRCVSWKTET